MLTAEVLQGLTDEQLSPELRAHVYLIGCVAEDPWGTLLQNAPREIRRCVRSSGGWTREEERHLVIRLPQMLRAPRSLEAQEARARIVAEHSRNATANFLQQEGLDGWYEELHSLPKIRGPREARHVIALLDRFRARRYDEHSMSDTAAYFSIAAARTVAEKEDCPNANFAAAASVPGPPSPAIDAQKRSICLEILDLWLGVLE